MKIRVKVELLPEPKEGERYTSSEALLEFILFNVDQAKLVKAIAEVCTDHSTRRRRSPK